MHVNNQGMPHVISDGDIKSALRAIQQNFDHIAGALQDIVRNQESLAAEVADLRSIVETL